MADILPILGSIEFGTNMVKCAVIEGVETTIFQLPACLTFSTSDILIGDEAVPYFIINPTGSVYDIQRLIGRRFDDGVIQANLLCWLFPVVEGQKGFCNVALWHKGKTCWYSVTDIAKLLFAKMKTMVEQYYCQMFRYVTIAVPACFSEIQCDAVQYAAVQAGFNKTTMKLTTGTRAVAALCAKEVRKNEKRTVLVVDFGAGKFDAAVYELSFGGKVCELGRDGDPCLGGRNIDQLVVDFALREFRGKYSEHLLSNPHVQAALLSHCQTAKHILSSETRAIIDFKVDTLSFTTTITRVALEIMCQSLIARTQSLASSALRRAHLSVTQLDDIVVCGGCYKMPMAVDALKQHFGRTPTIIFELDEAVVLGATECVVAEPCTGGYVGYECVHAQQH